MFIQVMQSRTSQRDEVKELMAEWVARTPDSPGWLGGTFGFTDDGDFLAVVRFENRELAMANSDDPQTGAFAERLAGLMDAPVEFQDCDDVTVFLAGGSDDAGFVQVIRGRLTDRETVKSVFTSDSDGLQEMRPEIIGGTLAIDDEGGFTQTVAFTDEASAREGEKLEPPEELRDVLDQMMGDARFYDLRDVFFASAG